MKCKACGYEIEFPQEVCSHCGAALPQPSPVDEPTVAFQQRETALPPKDSFSPGSKGYDQALFSNKQSRNAALKASILTVIALIITIGSGTIFFLHSAIERDASVRYNTLVELGAREGIYKLKADKDLGKSFYVSGVTSSLPLYAQATDTAAVLEYLQNGHVVQLKEKTSINYWRVYDVVSQEEGYVSPLYLTADAERVITFQNEIFLASMAVFGNPAEKIQALYYVYNAPKGVFLYGDAALSENKRLGLLENGNTLGLVAKINDKVWRVYDYRHSTYGYIDCQYLVDDVAALEEAKAVSQPEQEKENAAEKEARKEENGERQGPEYVVSWSESPLALRDAPDPENAAQISRLVYGDKVELIEQSDENFWYVYVPAQKIYGYVKAACIMPRSEFAEREQTPD